MAEKTLAELYAAGASVTAVVKESLKRAAAADRREWIHKLPEAQVLEQAAALEQRAVAMDAERRALELPLLGMTFAVKDNIEVKGQPITNAMDYRSGGAPVSSETAAVVARLMEGGAVLLGKTNMDCAATGLVGVRSPYGACQNSLDRKFISGGSSSGSGVVVGTGQVSFALGTDTAGSGRVPAMLNNIVGLKASRGLVSAHGLLPACRSLDCMTIFAMTVPEAWAVLRVAASADGADDPWDRPHKALSQGPRLPPSGKAAFKFAIPSKEYLDFSSFGEVAKDRAPGFAKAWQQSLDALKAVGGECVEVDYTPFHLTAKLLYEGPWVAERYSALQDLLQKNPDIIHPIVRKIVEPAGKYSAKEAFEAFYKLREMKQRADKAMAAAGTQILITPTAGSTYTIEELEADPIALNSNMGRYTNHMNLLDLCGVAVPICMAGGKLPFGVTINAPAGQDALICDIAARLHIASGLQAGASASAVTSVAEAVSGRASGFLQGVETFQIVVSGAHMVGLALSPQLTARGARFVRRAKTAPRYRVLAFDGMKPPRPGLRGATASESGASIEVEVWEMPAAELGAFTKLIAAPLGLGWIEMEDGSRLQGFRLVDGEADRCGVAGGAGGAPADITEHGGWRKYLESSGEPKEKRARTA